MSDDSIVLVEVHVDLLRDQLDWMLDEPGGVADKMAVVNIVLDYGLLGRDEAAVAHYVLMKLPLSPSRDRISFSEVDAALSELVSP